jgi:hypothetical protein
MIVAKDLLMVPAINYRKSDVLMGVLFCDGDGTSVFARTMTQ